MKNKMTITAVPVFSLYTSRALIQALNKLASLSGVENIKKAFIHEWARVTTAESTTVRFDVQNLLVLMQVCSRPLGALSDSERDEVTKFYALLSHSRGRADRVFRDFNEEVTLL